MKTFLVVLLMSATTWGLASGTHPSIEGCYGLMKLSMGGMADTVMETYVHDCEQEIQRFQAEVCESAHGLMSKDNTPEQVNEKTKCQAMPSRNPFDSVHKICRVFARDANRTHDAKKERDCYIEGAINFDFSRQPNTGMEECEAKGGTIEDQNVCFETAYQKATDHFENRYNFEKMKKMRPDGQKKYLGAIYKQIDNYFRKQVTPPAGTKASSPTPATGAD